MTIGGTTAAGIAASVRDLVGAGRIGPGDMLPPIRTLAAELGVNRNTVAAAYRQLVAAGVAETHGRGGTAIARLPAVARDGGAARRALGADGRVVRPPELGDLESARRLFAAVGSAAVPGQDDRTVATAAKAYQRHRNTL
jgi:DNA-binding transcriptional MocR family regulator